jgi:TATA element modulatory factor
MYELRLTSSLSGSQDLSRSNSGARANDRLQERLNRAIAKRNSEGRKDVSSSAVNTGSGAATPPIIPDSELPERKNDPEHVEQPSIGHDTTTIGRDTPADSGLPKDGDNFAHGSLLPLHDASANSLSEPTSGLATPATASGRTSFDNPILFSPDSVSGTTPDVTNDQPSHAQLPGSKVSDVDLNVLRFKIEHEALEKRLQEELLPYIEKIDALQSKLQYLSQEAVESAQQAAAEAPAGSAEQKMAEKDKKIALLMEEGQTLSKNEMKHLAIIKTLRSQAASTAREQSVLKGRTDAAEKGLATMEQRAIRAERKLQSVSVEDRELEAIKRERNALSNTIAEMKAGLARMTARAEAAERQVQTDDSERLRKQNQELRDDMTSYRLERELAEEKLRQEIGDLTASIAREKERFNAMETEMLGEQAALEAKLESLRSRAEENSSTTQGDAQAKLLRQIETLQTQYSVASENWQRIEGSLLSRITTIESERDEAVKREADLRRKGRDAMLKAKRMEEELEKERDRVQELERICTEQRTELQQMTRKARETDDQLSESRKALAEQRESMEKEISSRLVEERARWTPVLPTERTASPVTSLRKSSALDLGHLMGPTQSRRPSALPLFSADSTVPPRQSSTASFRAAANGTILKTPSIASVEHDEFFGNGVPTPTSPPCTHRGVNDLISTSTMGAGPSVQLVERMSATVRRLETEKAASKDELARLTAQRDEARQEVVSLMREVEIKRANDERVKALEEEQRAINERYQTTLELLGEKSELVEELKADVADVKQMYRDLVESTMK